MNPEATEDTDRRVTSGARLHPKKAFIAMLPAGYRAFRIWIIDNSKTLTGRPATRYYKPERRTNPMISAVLFQSTVC
jgi:hypothetical protein